MSLQIHPLPALKDNYIYALNNGLGQCAVIDPGEATPVLNFLKLRNLKLSHILCTHHHWDHINGVAELAEKFKVPVYCSAYDQTRIPAEPLALGEDQPFHLLGEEVLTFSVPGHTLGQIAFWLPKMNALFVGDTLFSCGCGRLFEGSPAQMYESLQKIKSLPPQTQIFFGHEYTVNNLNFLRAQGIENAFVANYRKQCEEKILAGLPTSPGLLETELKVNPFLQARSVEEFRKWRDARDVW